MGGTLAKYAAEGVKTFLICATRGEHADQEHHPKRSEQKKTGKSSRLWISGVMLLAACLVVPHFLPNSFVGMIVARSLATLALVGLVPLVPFLTLLLSRLIAQIPGLPFTSIPKFFHKSVIQRYN